MTTTSIGDVRKKAIDACGGNLMLLVEAGSGLHGIKLGGSDDHDETGVFIEPFHRVMCVNALQETVVCRSKPEGERSGPGDLDIVLHSLRKWVRLLLSGNPTILQTLFVPDDKRYITHDPYWRFANLAPTLRTRRTAKAFLGYLETQRQRLEGVRGQKNVKRPELVEAHGYDTKYAAHAARLGFQGAEFMRHAALTLPMTGQALESCRAIRQGHVSLKDALDIIRIQEARVESYLTADIPDKPDPRRWDDALHDAYAQAWGIEKGA